MVRDHNRPILDIKLLLILKLRDDYLLFYAGDREGCREQRSVGDGGGRDSDVHEGLSLKHDPNVFQLLLLQVMMKSYKCNSMLQYLHLLPHCL